MLRGRIVRKKTHIGHDMNIYYDNDSKSNYIGIKYLRYLYNAQTGYLLLVINEIKDSTENICNHVLFFIVIVEILKEAT